MKRALWWAWLCGWLAVYAWSMFGIWSHLPAYAGCGSGGIGPDFDRYYEGDAPTFSAELGETGAFGPADGDGSRPPDPTPAPEPPVPPVPPTIVRPEHITALQVQLHATTEAYLVQRGWQHNCDAPGGCWLWEKTIREQSYRMNADEALNVEFAVQAEEDEAVLQLEVSE